MNNILFNTTLIPNYVFIASFSIYEVLVFFAIIIHLLIFIFYFIKNLIGKKKTKCRKCNHNCHDSECNFIIKTNVPVYKVVKIQKSVPNTFENEIVNCIISYKI